jgi:predicted ATP-grasp superfamily ATP-dependent carboligase
MNDLDWQEITSYLETNGKIDRLTNQAERAEKQLKKLSEAIDSLARALSDIYPPPTGTINWKVD